MKQEPEGFDAKPVWQQICDLVEAHKRQFCAVDGCDRPKELRQYCGMHYARLKRVGLHPKDEPRMKCAPSHIAFVDLLSQDTDDCIDWQFYVGLGYPYLAFKRLKCRVHRMVCEAINGPPPSDLHEAAHECGRSSCCNWRHLSWKTHADNLADKYKHGTIPMGEMHHAAKLSEDDVKAIRLLRGIKTRKALAEEFGVGRATLDNVIDRATWRHVA